MRNYCLAFAALYTSHVITNPTSLAEEIICVGSFQEYEAAYAELLFNKFPSSWAFHSVRFYGDQRGPRIYIELNKTFILNLINYSVQVGSNALNSSQIVSDSPRDSWSHGH